MYCEHCEAQTPADALICPSCKFPASRQPRSGTELPERTKGSPDWQGMLRPLGVYPLNIALFVGFIGWLQNNSHTEVIQAAVGGFLVGLMVATTAVIVDLLRRE
ncbi:hypothetical protein [Pseudomonas boanensis]|uniref:hypothetical protein n=1 Tax=Metapseudomonas boanensis TaxID=2822138 RepID=UPI0035D51923